MTPNPPESVEIEPERIAERLAALPGLDRVRQAAAGIPVYLVGGAVRDLLLGRDRADLDLVVEGDAATLGQRLGGEIRSHERFATATVHLNGGELDLATSRSESYARPGALPDVTPAPLADDLARRDFTINAMALPIIGEPKLIDPHCGLADLRMGTLRVLHQRSFVDDPTRALRAARYAARYGFSLEAHTEELLRRADLDTVSRDRTEAELRKLAREPRPRRGFERLRDWGLVTPGGEAPELIDAVAKLAASQPWAEVVDREEAVLAAALGRGVNAARGLAGAEVASPSEAVERARGHDGVTLALARALDAAWLDRYVSDWRNVRLEIDGDDLIAAGVPQGPAIGRGLAAAMRAKLDGQTVGADDELRVALAAARG